MLVATAAATLAVTIYTSLQAWLLNGCTAAQGVGVEVWAAVGAAVVAPVVMLSAVHVLRPERYGYLARFLSVVAIAVGAALTLAAARAALAALLAPDAVAPARIGEYISATVAAACAVGLGLVQVDVARRIRHAEREQSIAQARAAGLVAELQEEELRLRYELAETIHGSVQGTFVVMEARLRHLALSAQHADAGIAGELHAVAAQLERLREKELRALSGRLYPVDLERGLAPAVRALVVRLPPSVAVTAPDDAVFAAFESRLSHEARVLVVRVIEDAFSNALRHGSADHVIITARESGSTLHVVVSNNGSAPPATPSLSGLARLRRRAQVLGGELVLAPRHGGRSPSGARLALTLPMLSVENARRAAASAGATAAQRTPPPAP
ncbi:sensor histidine kinase [Microbacterium sp. oral taxon 186]|uniref:sensor histidine kinase n=1 Tax=Microbacterium sp. oral taxon 186 TaxID=712383 RepID=UPI001E3C4402|nr:ATP-binding protein [Microbacterium sp. oral taxon 186]